MAIEWFASVDNNGVGGGEPVTVDNSLYRYFITAPAHGDTAYLYSNPTKQTLSQNFIVRTDTGLINYEVTNLPNGTHYYYVSAGGDYSLRIGRELRNTAPTTPGAFTQPTGTLEIGDSKTISWGASTDAESNLANYILEASLNSGAWTQIGTPTANNFTYKIPTATNIQFRVKARDAGGLESAYRTSGAFNVQPPQYYWSKYNAVPNLLYNDDAPWVSNPAAHIVIGNTAGRSYIFDRNTNTYTLSSLYETGTPLYLGDIAYGITSDGRYLRRHKVVEEGKTVGNQVLVGVDVRDRNANTSTISSYSRGTLVQSNIVAGENAYTNNARNNDGFWYVCGSRVSESIAPPQGITSPATDTVFRPGNIVNIAFTASTATNISAYEVDYRYNNDAWTPLATNTTLTRSLTATTDSTKTTLEFRVRAKNTSNVYSDYIYSPLYKIQHNVAPVVTLGTENNKTLYENDSFEIPGTVQDVDNGNTVTVRYQISGGNERAIKAYLSNGSVELFSKTLTFKGGKLYDGETLITGDLVDGTPYTLHVWATDDKGGTSAIAERTFYVVPNRAPLLTVNTPVIEGNIDADTIQMNGTFSDPDGNNAKVSYRINSGSSVQVAEGTSGVFDFEVSFGQLVIGENTIVIEVVDSYGAKITKTIKLNKALLETPLLKNTERYRLLPPSGSAAGVLFYVQRNEQLAIEVAISMTQAAEAEQFTSLSPVTTAPLSQGSAIVEDEFYHAIPEPVDNIILQIDFTRTTITADEKIYVIMGAFN